jgi:hypothetical protein
VQWLGYRGGVKTTETKIQRAPLAIAVPELKTQFWAFFAKTGSINSCTIVVPVNNEFARREERVGGFIMTVDYGFYRGPISQDPL